MCSIGYQSAAFIYCAEISTNDLWWLIFTSIYYLIYTSKANWLLWSTGLKNAERDIWNITGLIDGTKECLNRCKELLTSCNHHYWNTINQSSYLYSKLHLVLSVEWIFAPCRKSPWRAEPPRERPALQWSYWPLWFYQKHFRHTDLQEGNRKDHNTVTNKEKSAGSHFIDIYLNFYSSNWSWASRFSNQNDHILHLSKTGKQWFRNPPKNNIINAKTPKFTSKMWEFTALLWLVWQ